MRREKPKAHTVIDMYKAWCKITLAKNPGYYDTYDHVLRMPGIRVIYNEKKEMVMRYTMFRCIIETYNKNAAQFIIEGNRFQFSRSLGYLFPIRVERDFGSVAVNYQLTVMARKDNPDAEPVYWTDEEYVSVRWEKAHKTKNETVYRFVPAKHSFKRDFSKANMENRVLRTRYKFYPLVKQAS